MLRKLTLSGLLQFVQRGTAFQVLCGCALSICCLILQVHVKPYREPEANFLKALVEAQIALTFLISFILRVLPQIQAAEPLTAETYGWVLVVSLSLLLVASVGLTAAQIWRRKRSSSEDIEGEGGLELQEGLVLDRKDEGQAL